MRTEEHPAKSPSPRTGLFTLANLLPARGRGAPSDRRRVGGRTPSPRRLALTGTPSGVLTLASLIAAAGLFAATATPAAAAAGCPNETLREAQGEAGLALPDCRAYEQVSPTGLGKNGADAAGGTNYVLASPSGAAVSYFSLSPFLSIPTGGREPFYRSARSDAPPAWSTAALLPRGDEPVLVSSLSGMTPDGVRSIVTVTASEPPLTTCEPAVRFCTTFGHQSAYVEDNATGTRHLLAPDFEFEFRFAAAAANDTRLLLVSEAQLLPAAAAGKDNLYLWDESQPPAQRLSLVGLVPSSGASCAGPACVTPSSGSVPGAFDNPGRTYTQNAISADGTRAFFTDRGTGYLYERLLETQETIRISAGPATFREATPDGRYVFYTEGSEFYRFDTQTLKTMALTAGAEGVLGDLGVSTGGATAYFVARGVLAANLNASSEEARKGAFNLYRWHLPPEEAPVTTFIGGLAQNDEADWRDFFNPSGEAQGPDGGIRPARVTPDGAVLLFASHNPLTHYPTATNCEVESRPCNEFFRYNSAAPPGARLSCVTCNPTGDTATFNARLTERDQALVLSPGNPEPPIITRNLSSNGSRVFFQTAEPLVPADVNGQVDVYEWEAPGVPGGSCAESSSAYSPQDAGCLYLISTGTSADQSYFGDASASGNDVFFFTRQPLVSSDTDNNVDVYDARLDGGIASQSPAPSAPSCAAEACRPPVTTPSAQPTPASESLIGFPNPTYCRPGFVKRNGACVRKKTHRKHHRRHRRHHARAHHRRTNRNRGGDQ